jgi:hypothetical protein
MMSDHPDPKLANVVSSDSSIRSAASASGSAAICVSPIENAKSQAPENMVKGKHQRRIDMTAPLRKHRAESGQVSVGGVVVNWNEEREFLFLRSRPVQSFVTALDGN